MAQKFLTLNSGQKTMVEASTTSTGGSDAGKIVALDGNGRIDNTMMPVGVAADTKLIQATENLAAGDLVNVYNSSGARCRKADGGSNKYQAHGYVLASVTSGQNATVYFEDSITGLTSITPGTRYYLSSTAGGFTATPLTTAGHLHQYIGTGIGTDTISFEPDDGIILA